MTLGQLGDSESVEGLISALRNRALASEEAKGAIAALSYGRLPSGPGGVERPDDREMGGPLPADALLWMGVPALEPILTLVTSHPELRSAKSSVTRSQDLPVTAVVSIALARLDTVLDEPDGADKALRCSAHRRVRSPRVPRSPDHRAHQSALGEGREGSRAHGPARTRKGDEHIGRSGMITNGLSDLRRAKTGAASTPSFSRS